MHLYLVVEIYESPQKKKQNKTTLKQNRGEYFLNSDTFVGIEKENKMRMKQIKKRENTFGQN